MAEPHYFIERGYQIDLCFVGSRGNLLRSLDTTAIVFSMLGSSYNLTGQTAAAVRHETARSIIVDLQRGRLRSGLARRCPGRMHGEFKSAVESIPS